MAVYLPGTFDTKGREIAWVAKELQLAGADVCTIDAGCLGTPSLKADISRDEVFAAAGTSLEEMQALNDRGTAVTRASEGVAAIVHDAFQSGKLSGILSLGGSAGTTIGTAAMRILPLGVPKLMVSTLASGQTRPYVGGKDILMMNSVVDIAGINRISRIVLGQAVRAMVGMVLPATTRTDAVSAVEDRPLVAASMFGVTTPCVLRAQQLLEDAGYEVLVFHATGNGGEAMEGLITDGLIAGVLDITTTELADELVGGVLSAGPHRLSAAARSGIPQVISVGATDMVNFGPRGSVPERFAGRLFYEHNATVTLMRTTEEENHRLGDEIGRKAAAAPASTTILFPERGVSAIDAAGQPFDDPRARSALLESIDKSRGETPLIRYDLHINDPAFADAAVRTLLDMMQSTKT